MPPPPQAITYNPCSEGFGGGLILKDIISPLLNLAGLNDISKFLSEVFQENTRCEGGGGVSALHCES